jgi:SP family general alpha glucoside:H+ symporter-like MFS transporter
MDDIDAKHAPEPGHIGLTNAQFNADSNLDHDKLHIGYEVIQRQKEETFRSTWRSHWRAAVWSLCISTALWMEGYDTNVVSSYSAIREAIRTNTLQVNSFFGLPQFKNRFGTLVKGKKVILAKDQAGLSNTATCGQIIGLLITGICQERYGMKRTYICGMIFMIATIFIAVFAQNLGMLYAAEVAMGIPWGMFQTLTTAYASGELFTNDYLC